MSSTDFDGFDDWTQHSSTSIKYVKPIAVFHRVKHPLFKGIITTRINIALYIPKYTKQFIVAHTIKSPCVRNINK